MKKTFYYLYTCFITGVLTLLFSLFISGSSCAYQKEEILELNSSGWIEDLKEYETVKEGWNLFVNTGDGWCREAQIEGEGEYTYLISFVNNRSSYFLGPCYFNYSFIDYFEEGKNSIQSIEHHRSIFNLDSPELPENDVVGGKGEFMASGWRGKILSIDYEYASQIDSYTVPTMNYSGKKPVIELFTTNDNLDRNMKVDTDFGWNQNFPTNYKDLDPDILYSPQYQWNDLQNPIPEDLTALALTFRLTQKGGEIYKNNNMYSVNYRFILPEYSTFDIYISMKAPQLSEDNRGKQCVNEIFGSADGIGSPEEPQKAFTYERTILTMEDPSVSWPVKLEKKFRSIETHPEYSETPFSFTLSENEESKTTGYSLPEITEVEATPGSGVISFDEITFTEPGTYLFDITETPGADPKIKYDPSTWTVKIIVDEDERGLYVKEVEYSDSDPDGEDPNSLMDIEEIREQNRVESSEEAVFVNISNEVLYSQMRAVFINSYNTDTAYTPVVKKIVSGKNGSVASAFTFRLEAVSDNAKDVLSEPDYTSIDRSGETSFSEIAFENEGIYEFEITELEGDLSGFIYDPSCYKLTVTVGPDTSGSLQVVSAEYTLMEREYGLLKGFLETIQLPTPAAFLCPNLEEL